MDIDVIYENKQVEFFSKIILCSKIINKPNVKTVKLSSLKVFLINLIKDFSKFNNQNRTIIYKDIWANSELFIILSQFLKCNYFALHEEDYIIFHERLIKKASNNLLNKKSFLTIKNFFTLSNDTKKFYLKNFELDKNIVVTGNPRYEYLNNVKKKGHFLNKSFNKDKVLLVLNGPIFSLKNLKSKKGFKASLKNIPEGIYTGFNVFDKAKDYKYTKSLLKLYIDLIQQNKDISFILRPYPLDINFKKNYERILNKFSNVELNLESDIFYCLDKSYKVISAPDNVALEAIFFDLDVATFYDSFDKDHHYIFQDHPFVKFYSKLSLKNFKNICNFIKNKSKISNENFLKNTYGFNNDTCNKIANIVTNSEQANDKLSVIDMIKNKLFILILSKISKKIIIDFNNKNFSTEAFIKFKNQYNFSISKLILYLLLRKFITKGKFIENLYKYCLGKNYEEHNQDAILSFFNIIDLNEIINFVKHHKLLDFEKFKIYLDDNQQEVIFEKKNKI